MDVPSTVPVASAKSQATNSAKEIPVGLTSIDRDLLTRCLAREPDAWTDFVDRFIGLVLHVIKHTAHARSVRLQPADIDDLCSDVFVTLTSQDFAVLRRFRGESSLATYLTVVSRRVIAHQLAHRQKSEALGRTAAHGETLGHAGVAPDEFRGVDDREEIDQMIDALPDAEAELVRQYHLEGKTYGEIAAGTGIPENSIGPALSRARMKLREQ